MRSFLHFRPWVDAARRFGSKARRNQAGTTAIEFAFVIGPFLALLFAIMEVALVYLAQVSMDAQTEKVSRAIQVGIMQQSKMNAQQFKDMFCQDLVSFMKCDDVTVDVRSSDTFAEAAGNLPKPLNSDGSMASGFNQFTPGGRNKVVVVNIYCNLKLLASLPAMGDFTGKVGLGLGNMPDGSRLMTATRAFRTEPY